MRFLRSLFNLLRFNKTNWKAVVLCVFAATIFWFFNALNKSYTTNITLPLAFDYSHENYIAVNPLPKKIRINVTGIGWNLFRKSTGVKISPLVIPLNRPSEVRKIVGSTLPALFSNQLDGLEINFVVTDTIHLNIQPKAGRWLTVALDSVEQNIKPDYTLVSNVRIIPDSIFVDGPLNLVTKLKEPIQLTIPQNIDENFRQDVEVVLPDGQLFRRNPPTVDVAFDVERLIEVRDSIQLTLVNIPSGTWPVIGINKIPVTIRIRESQLSQFNPDSARAVLDLKDFRRGDKKLIPFIKGLPPFSHVVKVDSIHIRL